MMKEEIIENYNITFDERKEPIYMKKLLVMSSLVSEIITNRYNPVVVNAAENAYETLQVIDKEKLSDIETAGTLVLHLDAMCNSGSIDNDSLCEIKSAFTLLGARLQGNFTTIFTLNPARAESPKGKEIINIIGEIFEITPKYDRGYALAI